LARVAPVAKGCVRPITVNRPSLSIEGNLLSRIPTVYIRRFACPDAPAFHMTHRKRMLRSADLRCVAASASVTGRITWKMKKARCLMGNEFFTIRGVDRWL